jgi:conjugal transfer pilus assembly protein TraK
MAKYFAIILGLALLTCFGMNVKASDNSVILPDNTTAVELSSSDINRIVCPGTINDLIFSTEKGVEGHFVGNNAFVKFKITKKNKEQIYATTPTELFVICNNSVYSLIATPKRIPSVTLRFSPGTAKGFKNNISHYQELSFEKKILQLIREAFLDEYPPSYKVTAATTAMVNLSTDLSVRLSGIVDVEGVGLRLKEYQVKSQAPKKEITINEKTFLRAEMGEQIVAVAVENHLLNAGESSRVFIVEQRGDGS